MFQYLQIAETLRKHTYSNMYKKFHLQKLKIFRKKTLIFFYTSVQTIHCGHSLEPPRRGGSNEYTHNLCFWAEMRTKPVARQDSSPDIAHLCRGVGVCVCVGGGGGGGQGWGDCTVQNFHQTKDESKLW